MKVKDFGQVFTPNNIVRDVLDAAGYKGENILKKHVIDNSCGDGAFLIEIVDRYIKSFKKKNKTLDGIEKEIEKYIHGIEMDSEIHQACIENLNGFIESNNLKKIHFDILCDDTLKIDKYDKKMDFVVGNPPYVRVHNLNDQYTELKKYSFCENGMTDLYIAFYEVGLRMLNKNGILCYITPNSFYNSLAGNKLRNYICESQTMELIMDVGHYQPFNVTTYTTICKIANGSKFGTCKYYKYDIETGRPEYICDIRYEDLFVDGNIILSSDNSKFYPILTYPPNSKSKVQVKNGFATLNDKIFIQKEFPFSENQIDVIKGSTGEWKKCIYPYDENGRLIPFDKLNKNTQKYFNDNKNELVKDDKKVDSTWYAFGRTQAINDVKYKKYAINTTIKDIKSIRINKVDSGKGMYSCLYMLTDISEKQLKDIICTDKFIEYLQILNKCKSGGYFTFSSKDLSKFVNSSLEVENND